MRWVSGYGFLYRGICGYVTLKWTVEAQKSGFMTPRDVFCESIPLLLQTAKKDVDPSTRSMVLERTTMTAALVF